MAAVDAGGDAALWGSFLRHFVLLIVEFGEFDGLVMEILADGGEGGQKKRCDFVGLVGVVCGCQDFSL